MKTFSLVVPGWINQTLDDEARYDNRPCVSTDKTREQLKRPPCFYHGDTEYMEKRFIFFVYRDNRQTKVFLCALSVSVVN